MNLLLEVKYQLRYCLPIWFLQLVTSFFPDIGPLVRVRGFLVSIFLPNRPKGFKLGRDVTLLSIDKLKVGNDVYIAKGSWLNSIGGLTLDDEVVLAPYVVISTNKHGFKDGSVARGGAHPAPVTIGFGTWVASHANIIAGVSVGKGNIVASNSSVTKSTPENVIVGGVPARVIKIREDNPSTLKSKHDVQ